MYSQKDHVKMMNSFLFDEWSRVFQPEDDINEIWTRWKQQFFLEVESFIPCVQRTSKDRLKQPPWFNRSISQLIRTKNRLFNRARSSGLPDHWEKYKAARKLSNKTAPQHLLIECFPLQVRPAPSASVITSNCRHHTQLSVISNLFRCTHV